jgi:hypothetical protein
MRRFQLRAPSLRAKRSNPGRHAGLLRFARNDADSRPTAPESPAMGLSLPVRMTMDFVPSRQGDTKVRRRDLIAAISAAVVLLAEARAQPAETRKNNDDVFSHFYSDPQPARLIGFLEKYQTRAQSWNAFPPVAGFFAVVFRRHPDWIDRLIPDLPDSRTAVAIVAALRLSGLSSIEPNLQSRLSAAGADPKLRAELAGLPVRLEELRVVTPTHLDVLWGASFASGDERYVAMVANFLATTANRSELIAIDVAKTALALSGGPRDILGQLKGKYGEEGGREIIFAAAAAWGLASNAQQHLFVDKLVTGYIAANYGKPTAKVLSALRPSKRN